ncbi:hypothetical protein M2146_002499 [Lachnospiraceae bacterium PF1-22]
MKKNMKKIITTLLLVSIMLSLTACLKETAAKDKETKVNINKSWIRVLGDEKNAANNEQSLSEEQVNAITVDRLKFFKSDSRFKSSFYRIDNITDICSSVKHKEKMSDGSFSITLRTQFTDVPSDIYVDNERIEEITGKSIKEERYYEDCYKVEAINEEEDMNQAMLRAIKKYAEAFRYVKIESSEEFMNIRSEHGNSEYSVKKKTEDALTCEIYKHEGKTAPIITSKDTSMLAHVMFEASDELMDVSKTLRGDQDYINGFFAAKANKGIKIFVKDKFAKAYYLVTDEKNCYQNLITLESIRNSDSNTVINMKVNKSFYEEFNTSRYEVYIG